MRFLTWQSFFDPASNIYISTCTKHKSTGSTIYPYREVVEHLKHHAIGGANRGLPGG